MSTIPKFTEDELNAAKEVKDFLVKENEPRLSAIFHAGEIVMWDEMRQLLRRSVHLNQFYSAIKIQFMTYDFPVYEFRPLPDNRKLLRYNNGNWTEDDGEFDLCFITDDHKGAPMCYYVSLPYRKNLLWSWVKDGQWGAYVSRHPDGNAWHYMTKDGSKELDADWDRNNHPNRKISELGMSKLSKKYGCANGSGVDMEIGDEYIMLGLVRDIDTKKILKFPKIFDCIYCGKHEPKKEDKRFKKQKAQ